MSDSPTDVRLTDTQLGILAALCEPISSGNQYATPATNQDIAEQVFLSVDAVKGHLRTLYRKFGIEDLPHNQKRARLVELAIEGGYVKPAAPDPARPMTVAEEQAAARAAERAAAGPVKVSTRRPRGPIVTAVVLLLVIAGSTLAISGVFNGNAATAPSAPSAATYRAEVSNYCKLALDGAPATSPGESRADRARGYLEVIETMRGRFESLVKPTLTDVAVERFGVGLTNAANYTSEVAEAPPAAGSQAEAKDVAELTFAAGQVQAGAVGYELGHDCVAIGELVARSARNAAAP
jgi:hypothetical protein